MKFDAPRILNAPPFWKFSHLKNAETPAAASKLAEVITGVRFAIGWMRSAALRMSSKVISVAGMFVHHVLERFALAEPLEIFDEEFYGLLARIGKIIGRVRRKQDIFETPEGMLRRQRLIDVNIERGAADPAFLKRVNQRRFVDHRAASHVDHHRIRFQESDLRRADHPARFV